MIHDKPIKNLRIYEEIDGGFVFDNTAEPAEPTSLEKALTSCSIVLAVLCIRAGGTIVVSRDEMSRTACGELTITPDDDDSAVVAYGPKGTRP